MNASLLAPPSSGDKSFGDCLEKSKSRDLVSCFNTSNSKILSLETHELSETHVCVEDGSQGCCCVAGAVPLLP
jgi:hypothetical protein